MLNTDQFTITDICMGTNKMLLQCLLHLIPKRLCIKQDRSYFMLKRTVFQRGTKLCPCLSVIEENIVSTFPPSPSPLTSPLLLSLWLGLLFTKLLYENLSCSCSPGVTDHVTMPDHLCGFWDMNSGPLVRAGSNFIH